MYALSVILMFEYTVKNSWAIFLLIYIWANDLSPALLLCALMRINYLESQIRHRSNLLFLHLKKDKMRLGCLYICRRVGAANITQHASRSR